METLTYEINGIKYFLFEIKMPIKNASSFNRKIKSMNGMLQSVKTINSLWSGTMIKIKYLIPEEVNNNRKQIQHN